MPDSKGQRGWVFYDAECDLCRNGVARWGSVFALRGFEWRPLQTIIHPSCAPLGEGGGAAERLGIDDAGLREEMKLLLPDGRVLGGIDAWRVLFRSVWWLWPLGVLLALPGFHAIGAACYRWIARHRYRLGGQCRVHGGSRTHRRNRAFFDLS